MTHPSPALPAAERAYEHVKHRIMDGTFKASSMLSEGEIAGELSVSRTPVREAFLRLEVEGFLKLYPKRGALVTPISSQDIREVYEARKLIDVHAAGHICKLDEASRAAIADALNEDIARQVAALEAHNLSEYSRLDAAFHQRIMDAGGNQLLAGLSVSLRERQQRFTATAIARNVGRARVFVSGHQRLADALRAGDIDTYAAELHLHLANSRNQL